MFLLLKTTYNVRVSKQLSPVLMDILRRVMVTLMSLPVGLDSASGHLQPEEDGTPVPTVIPVDEEVSSTNDQANEFSLLPIPT